MAVPLDVADHITTVFPQETRLRRGYCAVATTPSRAPSPHNLYYELHGDPSPTATKLLYVMGLNNSCFAWEKQVAHFGREAGYQVLVFDNRGVGHSDSPKGLYKTSEMALDTVELLDFVGWERDVHVIGVSMGGMVAQELALVIPERISSLVLTSTKAGDKFDLPSLKGVSMFAKLMTGLVPPARVFALVADVLFPSSYLDVEDVDNPGQTKRKSVEQAMAKRYALTRVQTAGGRFGQMSAAMRHRVSAEKLAIISKTIPRIAIITGDDDNLINPQRSHDLHRMLPGSELKVVENAGHALPTQIAAEYNAFITRVVSSPAK